MNMDRLCLFFLCFMPLFCCCLADDPACFVRETTTAMIGGLLL